MNANDREVPSDLITPREAAKILRCNLASIYRWLWSGKLRAWSRLGSRYLVSEADVRAMLVRFRPPALPPRRGA